MNRIALSSLALAVACGSPASDEARGKNTPADRETAGVIGPSSEIYETVCSGVLELDGDCAAHQFEIVDLFESAQYFDASGAPVQVEAYVQVKDGPRDGEWWDIDVGRNWVELELYWAVQTQRHFEPGTSETHALIDTVALNTTREFDLHNVEAGVGGDFDVQWLGEGDATAQVLEWWDELDSELENGAAAREGVIQGDRDYDEIVLIQHNSDALAYVFTFDVLWPESEGLEEYLYFVDLEGNAVATVKTRY